MTHPVYLGLREDKPAAEVVRDVPDPEATRTTLRPRRAVRTTVSKAPRRKGVPPPPSSVLPSDSAPARSGIVVARAPKRGVKTVAGVTLSHADRQLWPGITKLELAEYWQAVAEAALPGLAHRPLGIVRCPEGIGRERFFQKRTDGLFPPQVRDGAAAGSPYVALDDPDGLIAMAQMSAIELTPGARAKPIRCIPTGSYSTSIPARASTGPRWCGARMRCATGSASSGSPRSAAPRAGKGLHVVVPLTPSPDWDWERVKKFCRAFAELMVAEEPDRYVAHVKIADRHGRILIDWLRNAIGNTAIGLFCPRARPGAMVATPLAWDEVNAKLDPHGSRCGQCRSGSPRSNKIRGAASSMWISACRISCRRRSAKRHARRFCRKLPGWTSWAREYGLVYPASEENCCAGPNLTAARSWPLRIMCMSSIPARVTAADQKDLNPDIGRTSRLIARWSCSTMLLRYLTWRISMSASCSAL